ncbi:MAG: sulfotransferase domain-containing protein [Pseudomonadota bacterium]
MGKIIWLASYPKSGNTWLRLFLYAYFRLDPTKGEAIDFGDPALRDFSVQDVQPRWWRPLLGKDPIDASPDELALKRREAQASIAASAPGLVFAKTHNAFIADRGVPNIAPETTAGAFYVVRNPLDVVVSSKDHFGIPTIDLAIQQLNAPDFRLGGSGGKAANLLGSWSQHVESWAGRPRNGIFTLRYEDMLEDPTTVFGWVIGRLGHQVDPDRLAFAVAATRFDRMRTLEDRTGFEETSRYGERFFRRGVAGGWREAMTIGHARRVVEANHAMMERFGYLDERLARLRPKNRDKRKAGAKGRR